MAYGVGVPQPLEPPVARPETYPAVRPLSAPAPYVRHTPATRAIAAHLWESRLLGTPGDNGDPVAGMLAGLLAASKAPVTDDARHAFAKAAYTVMDSEVFVPGWREGDEGHWSDYNLALGVDYHPDTALRAAEGLTVAAGHPPVKVWPMKSSTTVCATHATIRAGYGAPTLAYYPLTDGRVLEVTGGVGLTTKLAEDIARAMDDGYGFDGVGVYTTADGTPWRWREYLRGLDADAASPDPRYDPQPGDTCTEAGCTYTVASVANDVVYATWVDDNGETGAFSMSLETWADDGDGTAVYARPAPAP